MSGEPRNVAVAIEELHRRAVFFEVISSYEDQHNAALARVAGLTMELETALSNQNLLREQLLVQQAEISKLCVRIDGMEHSTSWRATEPLRRISRFVRGSSTA
ncbi:hypothetical protein H4V99_000681 [Cryobacterium sp. CG_9.6]|nr:hypothetical protein [Cryobacterium sp. CG_9.6]